MDGSSNWMRDIKLAGTPYLRSLTIGSKIKLLDQFYHTYADFFLDLVKEIQPIVLFYPNMEKKRCFLPWESVF